MRTVMGLSLALMLSFCAVGTFPGSTVGADLNTAVPMAGENYTQKVPASDLTIEMIWIPEGKFWMSRTEVTWEVFDVFRLPEDEEAEKGVHAVDGVDGVERPTFPYEPPDFGWGFETRPVITIKADAMKRFCTWLSKWTEKSYRLPSEEEWAKACGETPSPIGDYAWVKENSEEKTQPVGQKKANKYGLHDMFGNVQEIVTTKDGITTCGGSWKTPGEEVKADLREAEDPAWSDRDPQLPKSKNWYTDGEMVGFRIVRPGE